MKSQSLTKKAGKAIWKTLSMKTKWDLLKANASILSCAACKEVAKKPRNLVIAGTVVAGAIAGGIILSKKK